MLLCWVHKYVQLLYPLQLIPWSLCSVLPYPSLLLFSRSVMSNSFQPSGQQHTSLPCPLLSPRVCSNSCPLSQRCHHLCHPLLLLSSIFPSIRVFSNESALHIRSPKYENFSFSISLPTDIQRWFSLGLTRIDHLAVQGTLKSLFQHHSLKASILQHSAFFMGQHSCMTIGKTIPKVWLDRPLLAKWCLLFNTLSRFVIAFLPRSKHLIISGCSYNP